MNADECLAAAGYADFDDHGDAQLLSAPYLGKSTLLDGLLRRRPAAKLDVLEQLLLPIHWDSIPRCRVAFGDGGATLVTGDGHAIYRVAVSRAAATDWPQFLQRISGDAPVVCTELRWEHLLWRASSAGRPSHVED